MFYHFWGPRCGLSPYQSLYLFLEDSLSQQPSLVKGMKQVELIGCKFSMSSSPYFYYIFIYGMIRFIYYYYYYYLAATTPKSSIWGINRDTMFIISLEGATAAPLCVTLTFKRLNSGFLHPCLWCEVVAQSGAGADLRDVLCIVN